MSEIILSLFPTGLSAGHPERPDGLYEGGFYGWAVRKKNNVARLYAPTTKTGWHLYFKDGPDKFPAIEILIFHAVAMMVSGEVTRVIDV